MMEKMQATIDSMQSDVAKCKKAMANSRVSTSHHAPKVEQPKPKVFDGKWDAQEVDTFLWHLERYFEGIDIDDEATKVRTASLYLSGLAALWWRCRHADMKKGLCRIDTLKEFKTELKWYFYLKKVVNESQKKMKELKHMKIIPEYIKEFRTLMLQIPDMTEDQLAFNFVDGLQEWAQKEVKRHDFSTIDETIAIAESLTKYQKSSQGPKEKDHKGGSSKGGGEKKEYKPSDKGGNHHKGHQSRAKFEEKKKGDFVPKGGCFVCKGPHPMRECPKFGSFNAIMEE